MPNPRLSLEEIEALDPISQRKYVNQMVLDLVEEYRKLIDGPPQDESSQAESR